MVCAISNALVRVVHACVPSPLVWHSIWIANQTVAIIEYECCFDEMHDAYKSWYMRTALSTVADAAG